MSENIETNNETRILYVDTAIAVVIKKIGEVCELESKNSGLSIVDLVKLEIEIALSKKIVFIQPVNRIDQSVSGCVILALDTQTFSLLSEQFANNKIKKEYLAIVEKKFLPEDPKSGTLEHYIRFNSRTQKAQALEKHEIRKMNNEWKNALLEWSLCGVGDKYSFLSIRPLTGRTHQIRVQCAKVGMPIKGDLKYGAKRSDPLKGIRLHAWKIQFSHPVTKETLTITCPIPFIDPLWKAFVDFLT